MKPTHYNIKIKISWPELPDVQYNLKMKKVPREKLMMAKVPFAGMVEQFEKMVGVK